MIFCSVAMTRPPIRRGGALRRGEELNRLRREDRQLKLERYPVSRDTPDDSRTGVDGSDFLDCLEAQNRAVARSRIDPALAGLRCQRRTASTLAISGRMARILDRIPWPSPSSSVCDDCTARCRHIA